MGKKRAQDRALGTQHLQVRKSRGISGQEDNRELNARRRKPFRKVGMVAMCLKARCHMRDPEIREGHPPAEEKRMSRSD